VREGEAGGGDVRRRLLGSRGSGELDWTIAARCRCDDRWSFRVWRHGGSVLSSSTPDGNWNTVRPWSLYPAARPHAGEPRTSKRGHEEDKDPE